MTATTDGGPGGEAARGTPSARTKTSGAIPEPASGPGTGGLTGRTEELAAEAARRAAVIQADARDARLRLLADDLVQLTAVVEQEVADEIAVLERRTAVEDALADVRTRMGDVERRVAEAAPELSRAQERFVRLQSLRDRMESTGSVAAERVHAFADAPIKDYVGPLAEHQARAELGGDS